MSCVAFILYFMPVHLAGEAAGEDMLWKLACDAVDKGVLCKLVGVVDDNVHCKLAWGAVGPTGRNRGMKTSTKSMALSTEWMACEGAARVSKDA